MKTFRSLILLLLASTSSLAAPVATTASESGSRFFPAKDLMTVGVYYYPEHWPQNQWDRDFAKMKEMGFEFVHMGEFAWGFMEPEEGRFDFAWLDRAVELARRYQLRVVLCTPTPCPPAWIGATA